MCKGFNDKTKYVVYPIACSLSSDTACIYDANDTKVCKELKSFATEDVKNYDWDNNSISFN